jgi:hypothetical protein
MWAYLTIACLINPTIIMTMAPPTPPPATWPTRGDENEKGTKIVSLPLPHSESR